MQVTLSLQQDNDATSCNWREITEIMQKWSAHHTDKEILLPTAKKGAAEISLNFTGDDLTSTIQELHSKLYDHQVNFTVMFSES